MYFDIVNAEYIKNYKIKLVFQDGNMGIVDLSSYPNENNVFKKFLDLQYFKNFKINFGTITWGNDELDIAPEHLYQLATGKIVSFLIEQNIV